MNTLNIFRQKSLNSFHNFLKLRLQVLLELNMSVCNTIYPLCFIYQKQLRVVNEFKYEDFLKFNCFYKPNVIKMNHKIS